ncbi:MAG: tRNA (adenosine(37)-N6)-dimethylallyltransferase MiaA [Mariprofundales bacterium]
MGATGCGKSALALTLAQQFSATIISCDSMQLYCGLDIGTAKPSKQEQQQATHALIDAVTLPASADAVWWAKRARAVIADCNHQGETPLIVGGTGMYLRALLQGFAEIPPENPAIRQRLNQCHQQRGIAYLYRMLQRVDPPLAARLSAQDSQRIMRALTVALSSHQPLSHWQQHRPEMAEIACPVFVLEMERTALYLRLQARFDAMMAQGWLQEAAWLKTQHLSADHPAMRAVGYRQLLAHLDGEITRDAAIAAGLIATRHYAKRQQTWFRHQCADASRGDAVVLQKSIAASLSKWN